MFGIFNKKEITIPVDNAQTVTELESWTVEWECYKDNSWSFYASKTHNAKVFIIEKDADEFVKQLHECSKFINTTIRTTKKKN